LTPLSIMKRDSFPFYKQLDRTDCGPTCLRVIAKYYGKVYSAEYLREKCHLTREGVSVAGIIDGAEAIGLNALTVSVNIDTLRDEAPLPCIAYWRQRHFVVIYKVTKEHVYVSDPDFGKIRYTINDFLKGWLGNNFIENASEGLIILLETTPEFLSKDDTTQKSKLGLKFIIPYLRSYKNYIVQLVLGLLVGSVIQLVFPFLTQSIVDYGVRYQNLNFIYLILFGQIMLFASQTGIGIIRSWLLLHLGARINIAIASDFLRKLMRVPLSFFDSKITGDIMQRVEDNRRVEAFLSAQSLSMIFGTFNAVIFLAVLMYYHVTIGLIFLISAVLYSGWVMLFTKRIAELEYKRFDESAGNSSSLIQIIQGISEIKLNTSERRRRWEWEAIQIKLFKISVRVLSLMNYQSAGAVFINEFKNIIITFLAAKAVVDGQITLGMMLAIQYIIGQLNAPLNDFIFFVRNAQEAKISLERIGEIHDKEDETLDRDQKVESLPSDKTISINNLSFRYGGPSSALVLDDLSFSLPAGRITAIVGTSGSGKTTLLKLLLKLYNPTAGTIKVGNQNLENIDTAFWRKQCGAVMQDGYIFTDTLAKNITESNSEGMLDKERLLSSVQMANIEEFAERLPAGYNTRIGVAGTSGVTLSGGQKQRVLIARAIYKNPEFLFLDEATSSLDANNERVIMEGLENYFQGKTVLIIAHRLSTVKKADLILVMERGKVIEAGNHAELTAKQGAYYALVKNQLELGN
jgi:ATP-binding cassette, subfamily B, bacterial